MPTFEETARAYFGVDFATVQVHREDSTWFLTGPVSGTLTGVTDYDAAIAEANARIETSAYTRVGQWLISRDEETTGAQTMVVR